MTQPRRGEDVLGSYNKKHSVLSACSAVKIWQSEFFATINRKEEGRMRLKDKAAIVTGSGRGIGEGIALRFAEEGAKVVVNDVNEADAKRTVETIQGKEGKAVAVVGSVTVREVAQKMVDIAVKEFGTVDILVNNAG